MPGARRPKPASTNEDKPFWRVKTLEEMSDPEWESLCDGCGRCCLNKLEDWDTSEIWWTNVACRYFVEETCRCGDYHNRHVNVPDCIALTPENVSVLPWLPPSCGYRLLAEGRDLYWWHPLVSGDPQTVLDAGISVRGRTLSEENIPEDELEDFIVKWPGESPGKRVAAALRKAKATSNRGD
jgi:uncharacterized protein